MEKGIDTVFPVQSHLSEVHKQTIRREEYKSTTSDFTYWLSSNYNFNIGASGTGSMSQERCNIGTE